jgi:hypothetical protein
MKYSWILIMALAAGCAEQTPVDLAPCPCLEGYTCCPSLGQCLPTGSAVTLCPSTTRPPPLSCTLEENDDGSSLIRCSDGTTYPGKDAPELCGAPDIFGDVHLGAAVGLEIIRGVRRIVGTLDLGSVDQATALTIELPCLQSVDRLSVQNIQRAPLILSLPALTSAREVYLSNNVTELEAPLLTEVDQLTVSTTELSSLEGLRGLRHVRNNLVIADNPRLTSLAGLTRTATVGTLEIRGQALVSADALSGLRWVTRYIEIRQTSISSLSWLRDTRIDGAVGLTENALRSLDGLGGRPLLRGSLRIDEPALASLDALSALETVEGNVEIAGGTFTSLAPLHALSRAYEVSLHRTQVTSLEGLPPVLTTSGVSISDNPALRSLEGLVVQPSGDWLTITITGNTQLADLSLRGPADFPTTLEIQDNPSLTDLRGLEWLTTARSLHVVSNERLAHLTGLDGLIHIDGLTLRDNLALVDVRGLEALRALSGSVYIDGNARLEDLSALADATLTVSWLEIRGNRLSSLRGLEHFSGEVNQLNLRDEPALIDLVGLGRLGAVRNLELSGNAALLSLQGLRIEQVLDGVSISNHASLRSLVTSGRLPAMRRLSVNSNPRLTELEPASSATISESLALTSNVCLPQCLAATYRDRTEALLPTVQTSISGNRRDCTCTTAPDGTVTAQCPPRIECD